MQILRPTPQQPVYQLSLLHDGGLAYEVGNRFEVWGAASSGPTCLGRLLRNDASWGLVCRPGRVEVVWTTTRQGTCLWSPAGGTRRVLAPDRLANLARGPTRLSFSPDGSEVWLIAGHIWRWCADTWELREEALFPDGPRWDTLAPDGRTGLCRDQDLTSARKLWLGEPHSPAAPLRPLACAHFGFDDYDLDFSRDGKMLAICQGRWLWCLSMATCQPLFAHAPDGRRFYRAVAFTPDGKRLLAAHCQLVRVYETAGGRQVAAYDWGVGPLYCLAVSSDGSRAAAAGASGNIVLWDLD
jgi:WD40 repeat protein